MEKFGAEIGLFVSLEAPTRPMRDEALAAGFYTIPITGCKIERLQVRAVGDLLDGRAFDLPNVVAPSQGVEVAPASVRQMGIDL